MSELPTAVRGTWHRFLDEVEALRPELYRYCRYLTRSPWDAEDLAQDTLVRAFASLAQTTSAIENPRAWLFRIASNLWLNQVRHARVEREYRTGRSGARDAIGAHEAMGARDTTGARDAVGTRDATDAIGAYDVVGEREGPSARDTTGAIGGRNAIGARGGLGARDTTGARDAIGAPQAETIDRRDTREAAGTLLAQLAPQERAAIVLKDVFDFSLDEVAGLLSTTPGAVKSALHRGRGKLVDPEEPAPNPVERAVLDALCAAFNARDLDRVTALLLETAVVEYPGVVVEYSREAARNGTLHGALFGCDDPVILAAAAPGHRLLMTSPPRCEVRVHRGEPVMLCWWLDEGVDTVRAIVRVELDGDRISRMRTYMHSPEVLVEVGKELEVPVVTTGYR